MNATNKTSTTKAAFDSEIVAAAKTTKSPVAKVTQKIAIEDVDQAIWRLTHIYIESRCKDESALNDLKDIAVSASKQVAALKAYKDAMEAC